MITTERIRISKIAIPVNEIAIEAGSVRSANIVALSAFVARSGILPIDNLRESVKKEFARKAKLIPLNMDAIDRGVQAAKAC